MQQGADVKPPEERHDREEEIKALVEALPEPYRTVVELRFWGKYTHQQIAEELGWKDRTWTSTYLRRALERLQKMGLEL